MFKPNLLRRLCPLRHKSARQSCMDIFSNELISLCPDAVIGLDNRGVIRIFNRAAERLTGYSAAEINGKHIDLIYGSREISRSVKKKICSEHQGGKYRLEGCEVNLHTSDGSTVSVRLSATLLFENDKQTGSIGFFHDITERKELEYRLREMSIRDSLCGLYNHRHFYNVLSTELARARRYDRNLSLIFIDLDKFKQLNDSRGHLEGDHFLRHVGKNLQIAVRKSDHAFRYGGDEFMVILPETSLNDAHQVAERIRVHLNASWPATHISTNSDVQAITLSIGVAEALADDDLENLVSRADLAMYRAKKAGGNRTIIAESEAEPLL